MQTASHIPRDAQGPSPRRREQHRLRKQAIALGRWAAHSGWSAARAAERLGIELRALERWQHAWCARGLHPVPTGRPRRPCDPLVHQEVLEVLECLGPHTGLPTLQALFPGVARSQIVDLQKEFRAVFDQGHLPWVLHWLVPGSVWACDFTQPEASIDGCYPYLLIVRDLASRCQLLALPAEAATAEVAAAALEALFRTLGAPLVLKHDNGGHFTAPVVRALLAAWQVVRLLSPPVLPRYNGAIEAGMGPIKVRAHYLAARHGPPAESPGSPSGLRGSAPGRWVWSSDDVEAARLQANATLRPWGPAGPTPEEAWSRRPIIISDQRQALWRRVRALYESIRVDREHELGHALDDRHRAALARVAVRRALEELGYLLAQRSRITPPINA
jgi:transposase